MYKAKVPVSSTGILDIHRVGEYIAVSNGVYISDL